MMTKNIRTYIRSLGLTCTQISISQRFFSLFPESIEGFVDVIPIEQLCWVILNFWFSVIFSKELVAHLEELVADSTHLLDTQLSYRHDNVGTSHAQFKELFRVSHFVSIESFNILQELIETVVCTLISFLAESLVTNKDLVIRVDVRDSVRQNILSLRREVPYDVRENSRTGLVTLIVVPVVRFN